MKLKGPVATLIAGAAVAAGLLGANLAVNRDDGTATVAAAVPPTTTTTTAVTTPPATSGAAAASAPNATGTATGTGTGTGTATTDAPVTYAGKVNGGGSLSVVVKGRNVVGYLCDGKNESWLWGVTDGSGVQLGNRTGDTLSGTRGGGKLSGSLRVNGSSWTFSLPKVTKPSGLYRATAKIRGAEVVGGWIVLPDGSQVGVLRRDGRTTSAPAIDVATGTVTVDGTQLTATEPDPADTAR